MIQNRIKAQRDQQAQNTMGQDEFGYGDEIDMEGDENGQEMIIDALDGDEYADNEPV